MRIGEICTRSVVTCSRATRVADLARMMRDQHVGAVIIVEPEPGGRPRPVGIVTDRDLVVQVIAKGADPEALLAGDLAVGELVRAGEADTVYDAVWQMRGHGVRRLPVVDDCDGLVGVLAADDVIRVLAESMADVARTSPQQIARERLTRS